MARSPHDRIFGIETEYGCLVADEQLGTPEGIVEAIKDYLFYDLKIGALDLHARDEVFEPAQSGGFLVNGGRLYIDAVGSHLEYATAECTRLNDVVANDRGGQRLIVRAIREMGLEDVVSVYNNSVDHFGGHTFGCHENYLVRMEEDFFSHQCALLYPFLVTRQIYSGVGRVGGHVLAGSGARPSYQDVVDNPIDYIWVSQVYGVHPDETVRFQLSQRADHILKTVASRVRFNRALINPKWEHYYSHESMQRLHLLFGEANQNEYAYALKVGTTSLALRLIEDRLVPESWMLAQPLISLRTISRDETYKWPVILSDGSTSSAIEVQTRYLEAAQHYRGESEQTDWALAHWESILAGLAKDPMSLGDRIDWVAKRQIIEQYMAEEHVGWDDDALHSVDLEYHNIDPAKSLFYALQDMGQTQRVTDELEIIDAMTESPKNTRAAGRSALVRKVVDRKAPRFYVFDWNGAAIDRDHFIEMSDPFQTYLSAP